MDSDAQLTKQATFAMDNNAQLTKQATFSLDNNAQANASHISHGQ